MQSKTVIMSLAALAVAVLFCLSVHQTNAAPISENDEIRQASREAFKRGLNFFGDGIQREDEARAKDEQLPAKQRVYSHYTENIQSQSQGKPAIVEQYRRHHYYPQPASFIPVKFPKTPNGKYDAKQTAEIFRPRGPYQASTDRLRIP